MKGFDPLEMLPPTPTI